MRIIPLEVSRSVDFVSATSFINWRFEAGGKYIYDRCDMIYDIPLKHEAVILYRIFILFSIFYSIVWASFSFGILIDGRQSVGIENQRPLNKHHYQKSFYCQSLLMLCSKPGQFLVCKLESKKYNLKVTICQDKNLL